MKTQILFLTLCISLLLSGCQKAPEAPPAVQAEEAPWEAESQDSQSSYNDSTQGPHSQEFRKIYGEEDGADWWKTAAQEEAKDASGVDQYDDAKTWSWAPYETLYRTAAAWGWCGRPMVRGTSVKFQTQRSGFG